MAEMVNPSQEAQARRQPAQFRDPGGPRRQQFEHPQIQQLQPKRNLAQPQFGAVSVAHPIARTVPEAQGSFSAGMVHNSMPVGGYSMS